MKNILVTGSTGRIGRVVMEEFIAAGYSCTGVDMNARVEFTADGSFLHRRVDLTDFGSVVETVSKYDAVVHLANVAYSGFETDHKTFIDNITINYNLFSAVSLLKLPKIVWLSSAAVTDFNLEHAPDYFPIDSKHRTFSLNTYGLSKTQSENMASYFGEFNETVYVGIRAPLVQYPEDYKNFHQHTARPESRIWHLWSYIDVRDLARGLRLAVESKNVQTSTMFLAAEDTSVEIPSIELCQRFFPKAKHSYTGDSKSSMLNVEEAKSLIGFTAQYSWRNVSE